MTDIIFQKMDAFISIILAAQLSTCDQISVFFFFFSLFLSLYFSREKLEKKQSTGDDKQKHSRIFVDVNRSSPSTIKEELMSSEIITFICNHAIPIRPNLKQMPMQYLSPTGMESKLQTFSLW